LLTPLRQLERYLVGREVDRRIHVNGFLLNLRLDSSIFEGHGELFCSRRPLKESLVEELACIRSAHTRPLHHFKLGFFDLLHPVSFLR
jgi:hypothetical protein